MNFAMGRLAEGVEAFGPALPKGVKDGIGTPGEQSVLLVDFRVFCLLQCP